MKNRKYEPDFRDGLLAMGCGDGSRWRRRLVVMAETAAGGDGGRCGGVVVEGIGMEVMEDVVRI